LFLLREKSVCTICVPFANAIIDRSARVVSIVTSAITVSGAKKNFTKKNTLMFIQAMQSSVWHCAIYFSPFSHEMNQKLEID